MKVRYGLALVTAFAMMAGACASGGGGPAPSGPEASQAEEGLPIRDNSNTRSADLFLMRALSEEDEAQQQQRYQQALGAALAGITENPDNPKSYFQAGQAYIGLGDYAGADSMLTRTEEMRPAYASETVAYREQGWINLYNDAIQPLNAGQLEEAAALFEQADRLYRGRDEALLNLGSIYSRLGENQRAVDVYSAALVLLEENKEEMLADTTQPGIWENHFGIVTTGLAQVYVTMGRHQEAAGIYEDILAENPDDLMVLGNLATVLTQMEMADSAQALYDRILQRPDISEGDLFNVAVGLYQIENYEMAALSFAGVLEMNPMHRDAALNLAQTLSIAEDYEGLIPASQALAELDPRNALAYIYQARAFSETDRTQDANEIFREYQDFGYEISELQMQPYEDGGARLTGQIQNHTKDVGSTVTLRFHFGGEGGVEIGTLDVNITVPEAEAFGAFDAEFSSSEYVRGYRYEVLNEG